MYGTGYVRGWCLHGWALYLPVSGIFGLRVPRILRHYVSEFPSRSHSVS